MHFIHKYVTSLCSVYVNNFSKTTIHRNMLFLLKDTLSIKDEKQFKACISVYLSVCQSHYKQGMHICLFVCLTEPLQARYPHPKCENFNTLSPFSHILLFSPMVSRWAGKICPACISENVRSKCRKLILGRDIG